MKVKRLCTYKYHIYFLCIFLAAYFITFKNYIAVNVSKYDVGNLKFQVNTQHKLRDEKVQKANVDSKRMKYILQWTLPISFPFVYMGLGQNTFIKNKCAHVNCFVTSDERYLGNITKFDAIVFAGTELNLLESEDLPKVRSPHQKYVFANIESAATYPICKKQFDGYFNWTWTYKLDSDSRWGYIIIRTADGKIFGPNKIMHWMKREDMLPVPNHLRAVLQGKTKLAAWYVSNCETWSGREMYVKSLNIILYKKYKMNVDIYGECGNWECPRDNERYCDELIRRDYFFYLAFENAFSEDYVTEKLLRPLQYNAIPIVYGGANYSRFLPDGSYIDASEVNVRKVAKKMYDLMNNYEEYVEYFKWTNHYSYHKRSASIYTDDYCSMCALLNDDKKVKEITVYKELKKWWNVPAEKC